LVDEFGRIPVLTSSRGAVAVVLLLTSLATRAEAQPPPPSMLGAQIMGRTVTLRWSSSPGATSYIIEAGSRFGASDIGVLNTGSPQPSFTVVGVADGIYFVRVRAVNSGGVSSPSMEIGVLVAGTPCTAAPVAPDSLRYTLSGRVVTITWFAQNNLTALVLEYDVSPFYSNLTSIVLDPLARSLTAAAAPGSYYVRLRAVNACGTSAPSSELVVFVQ
jgi:hypothetical protein